MKGKPAFDHVLEEVKSAREELQVDLLAFMVLDQFRYKAVIHLVDILLRPVTLAANEPFQDELLSNINWPENSFAKTNGHPLELDRNLHVSRRPSGTPLQPFGNSSCKDACEEAMKVVWSLLASLVIAASKRPPDEARKVMRTVHEILARVHELGLIPSGIYSHRQPQEPSTVRQPPTLHLLSSKILSTLSDAVWHAYQDEVTLRSKKDERSPWSFFPEPPGSPLRSRGKELGPEIWIELILWCCVEGGLASTAVQIIKSLRRDSASPWQTVRWPDAELSRTGRFLITSRGGPPTDKAVAQVDVQVAGGNEPNIISAEVVLAVADCLVNTLVVETQDGSRPIPETLDELTDLISFLQPHTLTLEYLDFLAVRVLQTDLLYGSDKAESLRHWVSTLTRLCDLYHTDDWQNREPGLTLDVILSRSELRAGLLHQSLQVCTESNLVKKAVDIYTTIQKTVDGNKLRTIGEFLSLVPRPRDGFFTSRPSRGHAEFLNSYGQLPTYKLTSFLDLICQAGLFGLGDWLLYSEDVDGAALHYSTWGQPTVAAAVARYAAAKSDYSLLHRVFSTSNLSRKKTTVNALRAFVGSYVEFRQWDQAERLLQELTPAIGGGYSPKIVATLLATILRMESDTETLLREDGEADLEKAKLLLCTVLDGAYNASSGSFRIDQKTLFRQQMGFLLRLMENLWDTQLSDVASNFKSKFPISNEPHLNITTFNLIFAAIVQTKGALEGRKLWYLFCKDPREAGALEERSYYNEEDDPDDLDVTELHEDEFLQPRPNEGGDPARTGGDDRIFMSTQGSTDHPDDIPHPAAAAYLRSLQIDPRLKEDSFAISNVPKNLPLGMGSKDTGIAFEDLNVDLGEKPLEASPVVVPDMHTLEIIVRQALREMEIRDEVSRTSADLAEIVQWAEQFYPAFHLTPEDVKTEFRVPPLSQPTLKAPTKNRGRSKRDLRFRSHLEKFEPDVSGRFSKGAVMTRLPGERPTQRYVTHLHGETEGVSDDDRGAKKEGNEGDATSAETRLDSATSPQFRVRKFKTSTPPSKRR